MRAPQQLVHARTRVGPRHALMPLEGFPASRLPSWPDATVRVLAAPALGAKFVQHLIDLPVGKTGVFAKEPHVEVFVYVMTGSGMLSSDKAADRDLTAGSFALLSGQEACRLTATSDVRLLTLMKRYEPAPGYEQVKSHQGHVRDVAKTVWAGSEDCLLQTLIPDDFAYDLAMNIFTFTPGYGLPVVETHVMEHGALILEGKGLYYLEDSWVEVEKDDFIWMGPFCPQSFYATGPGPASYIYYKNVNREITL